MPKTSKFSKYFENKSKEGTLGMPEPKVHINEATLKIMGQAAKDFRYTELEFVEAVEMYQYFGNQNLEACKTDYQNNTDLMATTKMYIAPTSTL